LKPLLIFQLSEFDDAYKAEITETIEKGVREGCLIVDSRIAVLSFDENGKMNYCSPRFQIK